MSDPKNQNPKGERKNPAPSQPNQKIEKKKSNNNNSSKNNNKNNGHNQAAKSFPPSLPWTWIWIGGWVAVLSGLLGVLTPPLLFTPRVAPRDPVSLSAGIPAKLSADEQIQPSEEQRNLPENPGPESVTASTETRTLENDHSTTPLDACRPERLQDFWHEEYVPGFHLVCFAPPTTSESWSLRMYPGGVRSMEMNATGPEPLLTWTHLRQILQESLEIAPASELRQAWALFSAQGERLADEETRERTAGQLVAEFIHQADGLLLLYEGGQFLWPGVRLGFERTIALYAIMPPGTPPQVLQRLQQQQQRQPHSNITLQTLSLVPLVLAVQGFLTHDECQHIRTLAEPHMEYSEVVLMDKDAGRPASDFRTSQTTFLEAQDDILVDIDYRTASLVRIPRSHQETVQVLRYGLGERYQAHTDFFDPRYYQNDAGTLRLIRNGRRNRLATVFWYLSDVAQGGETVFPRFNRGQERSFDDCETGLLVRPETGKVIIFYSMTADGRTDDYSLHGACPVKDGVKWAANKWVWNERMGYVSP